MTAPDSTDHRPPGWPRVVALGGGYGLSTSLRAIKHYATTLTGVVSVADDGGSSGRLRRAFGIPAPGDLRRCLVALADDNSVWAATFEHRFTTSELEGHPVGNIVLAGLTETLGDFTRAIEVALQMMGGTGRLLPATRDPVALRATFRNLDPTLTAVEGEVEGEAAVGQTAGLTGLSFIPENPLPHPDVAQLIAEADQVVIGPGSLYTSSLAVACVPGIRDALEATSARKIYVANLGEQHPETSGYDVARHVLALRQHGVEVDFVVRDPDALSLGHVAGPTVVDWPMATASGRLHDPQKLRAALVELLP